MLERVAADDVNQGQKLGVEALQRLAEHVQAEDPEEIAAARVARGLKHGQQEQYEKGRDLFDLATTLARVPSIDPSQIVRCFGTYPAAAGQRVSRAEFEENLAARLTDQAFTRDIGPLLVAGADAAYDAADAGLRVGREILSLFPGDPWKGRGAPGAAS